MEKEIIELYRLLLIERIYDYDRLLQSMIDDYDEKMYQDTLQEKTMIVYCLELLTKCEREIYNKEKKD